MMTDFYMLSFNDRSIDLFVEAAEDYDEQNLHIGEYTPDPLILKKSQGKYENHIVRLQDIYNFLISDDLYNNLINEGITGWSPYNIQIEDVRTRFYGFQVLGRSGELIRPDKVGFYTGLKFEFDTWDGSDFFVPSGSMMTLCTRRAKSAIEALNIKNIELDHIKNCELYNA